MSKVKVFLTGGDSQNWALDDDLRLTRQALQNVVELVKLSESQVVHTMWWSGLKHVPHSMLVGKQIVSQVPGEPFRYYRNPQYSQVANMVGSWITPTKLAQKQLQSVGVNSALIPYVVNMEIFKPISPFSDELISLKKKLNIPDNAYLIGNFHRDTEGRDLASPKLVKGPDVLAEMARALKQRGYPIHFLLAGPRRFWLRQRLTDYGIPYTFVGKITPDRDDISVNNLRQEKINLLYNLLDLCVVTSRSEGAPRSILEAVAAKRKIISSRVGIAPDILDSACIFDSPDAGIDLIARDIRQNSLARHIENSYQRVRERHQPQSILPLLAEFYANIENVTPYDGAAGLSKLFQAHSQQTQALRTLSDKFDNDGTVKSIWRSWIRPSWQKVSKFRQNKRKLMPANRELKIGIWHQFSKEIDNWEDYLMVALRSQLSSQEFQVVENIFDQSINLYLLNSNHFDLDQFLSFAKNHSPKIIHRLAEPNFSIQGTDREKEEECYQLNANYASVSIIQSEWALQQIIGMGYRPVNPIIVHNAANPEIFYKKDQSFQPKRKIRLISTSWSDNPSQGALTYKWIEKHLDWQRFEFTFVGRSSEQFEWIQHIDPQSSNEAADLLREHDIYISASQSESCANALIEALSCGLPALYLNEGSYPELVGFGGLPFNAHEEILPQLDRLVDHYEMFQQLISVPTLESVVEKYIAVTNLAIW